MQIGVDVGGTNTDGVILSDGKVLVSEKTTTTENVGDGVFNIIQAQRTGTHIITLTPGLIAGMKDLGRDLDDYSLDTVKMFYKDSIEAGFSI